MSLTDTVTAPELGPATETAALGIYQLKRLWSRLIAGPRMVQYINMFPTHIEQQEEWI